MHIQNLQRDAFWGPDPLKLNVLRGDVNPGLPEIDVTEPVFEVQTSANIKGSSLSAGTGYSFGVKIRQPTIETNPYRVKIYCSVYDVSDQIELFYGYVQPGVPGLKDIVRLPIAEVGRVDECIMIPLNPTEEDRDLPLGFGIYVQAVGNQTFSAGISVQRMAAAAPRFGAVMS